MRETCPDSFSNTAFCAIELFRKFSF
jgi:hypothetical protein